MGVPVLDQITAIVERVVTSEGLECVHCELLGSGARSILRVYIDKPGGVTTENCAEISRQLSAILDVEDLIPHRYVLEVSSPGIERRLYRPADYERFAGRAVKIRTVEPIEGRRNFHGMLMGLSDDRVILSAEQGVREEIPLGMIARASLEFEG